MRRAQVNYKNVMKQYNLGPNGGILTALNLFATRFDQARAAGRSPRPHTSCQTNASRKVSAAPPPFLKRCRCSALVARAQSRTLALAFQGFKGQFKGFQALACRRAGRGAVRAAARPAAALHRGGHTRADRDLHLVGVGRNYHRGARVGLPDHGRVRGGHAALRTPADLHEQHAAGVRTRTQKGSKPYPKTPIFVEAPDPAGVSVMRGLRSLLPGMRVSARSNVVRAKPRCRH